MEVFENEKKYIPILYQSSNLVVIPVDKKARKHRKFCEIYNIKTKIETNQKQSTGTEGNRGK